MSEPVYPPIPTITQIRFVEQAILRTKGRKITRVAAGLRAALLMALYAMLKQEAGWTTLFSPDIIGTSTAAILKRGSDIYPQDISEQIVAFANKIEELEILAVVLCMELAAQGYLAVARETEDLGLSYQFQITFLSLLGV